MAFSLPSCNHVTQMAFRLVSPIGAKIIFWMVNFQCAGLSVIQNPDFCPNGMQSSMGLADVSEETRESPSCAKNHLGTSKIVLIYNNLYDQYSMYNIENNVEQQT